MEKHHFVPIHQAYISEGGAIYRPFGRKYFRCKHLAWFLHGRSFPAAHFTVNPFPWWRTWESVCSALTVQLVRSGPHAANFHSSYLYFGSQWMHAPERYTATIERIFLPFFSLQLLNLYLPKCSDLRPAWFCTYIPPPQWWLLYGCFPVPGSLPPLNSSPEWKREWVFGNVARQKKHARSSCHLTLLFHWPIH